MKKGVITSEIKVHNELDCTWNPEAAIKRVQAWATETNGDQAFVLNLEEYAKAFFWLDKDDGGAAHLKLPFADVIEGELKAIWAAVEAAMKEALNKDSEIPAEDRRALYDAVAKYYGLFEKEAPQYVEAEVKEVETAEDTEEHEDDEETKATKKFVSAEIVEKAKGDGTFTAVASTETVDRHGESIDVSGWNLKNFKKNPVLLWAHDHTIPAIGKATRIWISDGKLMFKGIWQGATEMGRAAQALVDGGFVNSFSVGFMPFEMDGNTYTKQELLEISLVNVPANPEAMMLAYKSLKKAGIQQQTMKELGMPVEVLDKLETLDKDVANLTEKVESLVKAQNSSAAPKAHSTPAIRAKQSLTKVIVRASNQLLAGEKKNDSSKEDRVKMIKVVKRAAEILSAAQKEQINNG